MLYYFYSISMLNLLDPARNIGCSERALGLDVGKKYLFKCDSSCGGSVYGCPKDNGLESPSDISDSSTEESSGCEELYFQCPQILRCQQVGL